MYSSQQFTARALRFVACVALIDLVACGSGGSLPGGPSAVSEAGPSPFISLVHLSGFDLTGVTGVQYTIAAKPGTVSKPVHVEYTVDALTARGYLSGGTLTVPVYGLYANYNNQVSMELTRQAGESTPLEIDIQTAPYADPTGIYSNPTILTRRVPGGTLGFDFIYIKSGLGSPIIVDTDAEVRWAAPGVAGSISSALVGDNFIIGNSSAPNVTQLRLDGNIRNASMPPGGYIDFNHDIDRGKFGLLAEVDLSSDGVENIESNVVEMRDQDQPLVLGGWDLASILRAYMASHGDDAAAFVRPGVDWFHTNSAIYDPSDDSIIVSSRENFVIKLDYKTGAIKWILGDPTKYWYTFPSLRSKALSLVPGGLYPVGQHGLSITSDGLLMLFNDGLGSMNEPAGEPAGITRNYSAVSAYSIDPSSMTAREVWRYDAGEQIYSSICSSAYEAGGESILVDYATAANGTEALLVGLDADHNVAFEFEYLTNSCETSWNARPIPLDNLQINQ